MYKKVWYPLVALVLGAAAVSVDAAELYRYVDDQGVTVLGRSVPSQYVSRGYEVLDRDGRVKQVIPPALSREERQAMREAEQELLRQRSSDETLLRLYADVADLDRAHLRQIQQIEGVIATAEGNLQMLQSQRDSVQSRAASQERAGRQVEERLLQELDHIEAERRRLDRLVAASRTEIAAVNAVFASRRERLVQLLAD